MNPDTEREEQEQQPEEPDFFHELLAEMRLP